MKVDMSPEAVTARLKLASQLRRLCLSLGKARPSICVSKNLPSRMRLLSMNFHHNLRMNL